MLQQFELEIEIIDEIDEVLDEIALQFGIDTVSHELHDFDDTFDDRQLVVRQILLLYFDEVEVEFDEIDEIDQPLLIVHENYYLDKFEGDELQLVFDELCVVFDDDDELHELPHNQFYCIFAVQCNI